jgi:hypothetical protein
MIACKRRYELEKSKSFIECPFIGLSNLKLIQCKNLFYLDCNVTALLDYAAPGGHTTRSLTTCYTQCVQTEVTLLWDKGGEQTEDQLAPQWIE